MPESPDINLNWSRPASLAAGPDCPRAGEWPRIASGAAPPETVRDFLDHAAQCDHCGPLIKATGALDDAITPGPEEAAVIARLQTPPAEQARLAARLASGATASRVIHFPAWRRPLWIYASAAAVVLAAVSLVLWTMLRPPSADQLLAEAYSQQRTLTLRFSGANYGPVQVQRGDTARSGVSEPQSLLDAKALIHRNLQKSANDPRWLDAKGRVDLLEGNYDAALLSFQKALDSDPASSVFLTDSASAYFERGEMGDRPEDFGHAFELLSRILKANPDDPIALYNRAVVAQKMFLYHQALRDLDHYLRLDPRGPWADEARQRRDEVRQKLEQQKANAGAPLLSPADFARQAQLAPSSQDQFWSGLDSKEEEYQESAVRDWVPVAFTQDDEKSATRRPALLALRLLGERMEKRHGDHWFLDFLNSPRLPAQASAVQSLSVAVRANATGDHALARTASARARQLFVSTHNAPGELLSGYETVYSLRRSNQEGRNCLNQVNSLLNRLSGRPYVWLKAQLYLERSICQSQLAHLNQARDDLQTVLAITGNSQYDSLNLRALGMAVGWQQAERNWDEAHRLGQRGLARYWSGIYPASRAFQFYGDLAFAAEDQGQWALAQALVEEDISAITLARQPLAEAMARYQLARYAFMAGDRRFSESESEKAGALFTGLPQNAVTQSYQANQEIRLAGMLAERGDANMAKAHLARAQALLPGIRNYFIALRFYKTLADLQLAGGSPMEAEKALRAAVAVAESGVTTFRNEQERGQWTQETNDLYRKLAWVKWQAGDARGALQAWEQRREAAVRASGGSSARPSNTPDFAEFAAAAPALPTAEVDRAISALADETVLSYLQFPHGLLIWAADDRGVTGEWVPVETPEAEKLARRFREECSHPGSPAPMLRTHARALYDLLIAPIAGRLSPQRTLIVEPDGFVADVPLAALMDAGGRYLAEMHPIVFSPGLLYREHLHRNGDFSSRMRALVVGSPALAGSLAMNLHPLEDAAGEAGEIASRFSRALMLTGAAATVENVEAALPRAAVFHFAGHAVEDQGQPSLLLAGPHPSSASAVFNARKIQPRNLQRLQLAVLSACSTGENERGEVSGPETLVRPFLQAGVPHVIAARWSVDSAATAKFMRSFYEVLLQGETVSAALQKARMELRAAPATAHPYYWAAFDAFGRR